MANIRNLKKDIDYLVSEVVSDCYTCLIINPAKKREEVFVVIKEAVDLRNDLIEKVNHPGEKNNPRLLKKYYAQVRVEMFEKIDGLFNKLSTTCKK